MQDGFLDYCYYDDQITKNGKNTEWHIYSNENSIVNEGGSVIDRNKIFSRQTTNVFVGIRNHFNELQRLHQRRTNSAVFLSLVELKE